MRPHPWRLCAAVLVGCGPSAGPRPIVPSKPSVGVAIVSPARWSWPRNTGWVIDARRFADVGLLLVGGSGRRALVRPGSKTMELAPTLVEGELMGSLRKPDGQFLFVEADGRIHVAKGALGPITAVRNGPASEAGVPTIGKSAVQFTHPDGRAVRTTDGGLTWTPSEAAHAVMHPLATVHSLELTATGHGLLVTWPQRLFRTDDDGGTWHRVDTLGDGASLVRTDSDGKVYLEGNPGPYFGEPTRIGRLDGDHLAPVATTTIPRLDSELAADVETATPKKKDSSFSVEKLQRVSGDRVFVAQNLVEDGVARVEVLVGSLGGLLARAPLGSEGESAQSLALSGVHALVVLSGEAGVRVLESHDGGVHFEPLSVPDTIGATPRVFATSDGAVWLAGDCKETLCGLFVRRDPKGAFERVATDEAFLPLAAVDDGTSLHVLALREDGWRVHSGSLASRKLVGTKLAGPGRDGYFTLTVDAARNPRVFRSHTRTLHRLGPEGAPLPVLVAPEALGNVELVGSRGFASQGYETRDGGEHWWKVPTIERSENSAVDCGAAGCMVGEARRLGWDLPTGAPAVTLVPLAQPAPAAAATTAAPPADDGPAVPAPTPVLPKNPPLARCKPSGPLAKGWPDVDEADLSPDVDWAQQDEENGTDVLRVGHASGKVDTIVLLPGTTTAPEITTRTRRGIARTGAWVARLHFVAKAKGTDDPYNPVDAEFAWWLAKDGKVRRATLKAIPPFRIGRLNVRAAFALVGDDLVFQPQGGQLYTVHGDGKSEATKAPDVDFRLAYRAKGGALGIVGVGLNGVRLVENAGLERRWALTDYGVTVGLLGGAPYAAFDGALLPLAGAAIDPPLEQLVAVPSTGRCEPGQREGVFWFHKWSVMGMKKPKPVVFASSGDRPWLAVEGATKPLYGTESATRTNLDGRCLAVERFTNDEVDILLSSIHPTRAWGMVQKKGTVETRRYSCAP
ncbi:MAG: exo-alpha-sialidase [Myxococcales bacterium]|nr:exo-alpha-sialidase [Myxococcales bacterium]